MGRKEVLDKLHVYFDLDSPIQRSLCYTALGDPERAKLPSNSCKNPESTTILFMISGRFDIFGIPASQSANARNAG